MSGTKPCLAKSKPCLAKSKEPCEPESEKKCKEPRPPPPEKEPECIEPEPPPYEEKVLFAEDATDPFIQERAKCLTDCHVAPVYNLLKECNKRVTRKLLYTAETCHEETVHLMEAIDHCVKEKAFSKLA